MRRVAFPAGDSASGSASLPQDMLVMVDVEFARTCAGAILARYGQDAEDFIRTRLSEILDRRLYGCLETWHAIYRFVTNPSAM